MARLFYVFLKDKIISSCTFSLITSLRKESMMDSFLVMRSFPKGKEPTLAKVIRDGENMYCEARHVIVLDERGEITYEEYRPTAYTGNYIAVFAPTVYKGEEIRLAVALEIGFSRSVPYQWFEKWHDGKKVTRTFRRPIIKLSDEEVIHLLPTLSRAIQHIVDQDVSHRRNLIYHTSTTPYGGKAKKGKELASGKFITVPNDESVLVFACLAKDSEARNKIQLSEFVSMTNKRLSKLKYAYYPKGELKRFSGVQETAEILVEADYPLHFAEVIRRKLGKETGKVRSLFEQIVEVFEIKFKETTYEKDLLHASLSQVLNGKTKNILGRFNISVTNHPKRDADKLLYAEEHGHNPAHAVNCIRVEILPSREAIEKTHPVQSDGTRYVNLSEKFIREFNSRTRMN